ncbi:MAG: hypothetical protein AAGD11_09175 [Planctomycetota bacterium]
MSQIDEAFIQAYAAPQQPTNLPGAGEVPIAPPLTGLHGGPHMRMQPTESTATAEPVVFTPMPQQPRTTQVVQPQATHTNTWTPEPIPAPHYPTSVQPPVAQHAVAPPPAKVNNSISATPPPSVTPPSTERRPLSTFAAPEPAPTTAFQPVFEVDAFRWPKITDDLLSHHSDLLIPVAEHLLDVCEQGRSLVGIAGTRPNVGCATLLLSLARLVASVEKSVAIVDANFAKATLASDLGLEFQVGWENVLTGELPLAECVVKSLNDRMALLPLANAQAHANELLNSIHTSVTAGVLRYHYDLVLFNLGAAGQPPQDFAADGVVQQCKLDAGIIVADSERTGIDPMDTLISLFGSRCLGVIGNSAA